MLRSNRWSSCSATLRDRTIVVASALLPKFFLFDVGNQWNTEWGFHAWAISYFAQFFAAHHYFSGFINTPQWIGVPLPQFYAFPLYAATALIALLTGSNIALRLMVIAVALGLAFQVYTTIRILSGSRAAALFMTFAVSCAPYQLTNIFSRGAIPEYVAVSLVTIALCAWLRFAFAPQRTSRDAWLATLSYAAAASIHPITALLGGALCVATFAVLAFAGKRMIPALRLSVPAALLALAVLSPWLFAVARYGHDLGIVKGASLIYIPMVDELSNRLDPLVRDRRVETDGLGTPTPYLDAQVNFPLLAFAALLAIDATLRLRRKQLRWSRRLTVACGLIAAFALLAVASGVPAVGSVVLAPFKMVQFAYRITSYLDLLLFVICAVLLRELRSNRLLFDRRLPAMLVACALLALHGVVVKTAHSAVLVVHPSSTQHEFDYIPDGHSLPPRYPVTDYATYGKSIPAGDPTPHGSDKDFVVIALPVYGGRDFGSVGNLRIFLRRTSFLRTNVIDFLANDLLIDGKPLAAADRFDQDGAIEARVSPGWRTIGYVTHVGKVALLLRALSILAFGILLWLVARRPRGPFALRGTGLSSESPI
jgi:hypothetical protein